MLTEIPSRVECAFTATYDVGWYLLLEGSSRVSHTRWTRVSAAAPSGPVPGRRRRLKPPFLHSTRWPPHPAVWLTTLGCAKNQVDSDKLEARLDAAGYARASSLESADVVMVNTCAFIEAARRESVDTVLDHADRKQVDARLVVLGCMAQRYQSELGDLLPEADAVLGMEKYGELIGDLDRLTGWQPIRLATSPMDILYEVRRPTPSTPYAYVKVAEGCDKTCTFCAIPQFRGAQRSRSPVNIREEIASLCEAGVGEIVLVAQDLAAFGRDIDAPGGIVDLLRFVSDVDGLRRLRLLYLYPREVSDAPHR